MWRDLVVHHGDKAFSPLNPLRDWSLRNHFRRHPIALVVRIAVFVPVAQFEELIHGPLWVVNSTYTFTLLGSHRGAATSASWILLSVTSVVCWLSPTSHSRREQVGAHADDLEVALIDPGDALHQMCAARRFAVSF